MIANDYRIGYTRLHNKVHFGLSTLLCNSYKPASEIIETIGSGRYLYDLRALIARNPELNWCSKCSKAVAA